MGAVFSHVVTVSFGSMANPISQKNRPIALVLWGGGIPLFHYFNIRPSDFRYEIPSRSNVHQTLGGAWIDDFGVGLKTITLSGTTGWRGNSLLPGEVWFLNFREMIYETYFLRRQAMANAGQDPDQVRLFYADTLNALACWVHPTEFNEDKRSIKPLIWEYRLRLVVVQELGILRAINGALEGIADAVASIF